MQKLYTTREVAEKLNIKYYRITYCLQAEHVPEPKRAGNLRLYDEGDIKRLEKYFKGKE